MTNKIQLNTDKSLSEIAKEAKLCVIEAGDYALSKIHSFGTIKFKALKNPQTDVDVATESILVKSLSRILPNAGFILEEHASNKKTEYNWAVDPIDGTKFFSTQFPAFFTQVALYYHDEIVVSVIYNPFSKQLFYAYKDGGSYLDNKRIRMQYDGPLTEAIVNLEVGHIGDDQYKHKLIHLLGSNVHRLLILSTLNRPYLLTNTVQAYIRYYGVDYDYDLAPAKLLVEEAGGVCHIHNINGVNMHISGHPKTVGEIEKLVIANLTNVNL